MDHRDEKPPPASEKANSGDPDRFEEFVSLLGQNQRRLFAYLMSLMHDRDAVEDVLQETNLVLWQEFRSFEPGTSFIAWSCRVAYNQMRAWRKKQQRDRLHFSDEFLHAVAEELETHTDYFEARLDALTHCLAQLPDHHRQLIRYRYTAGEAIPEIANRTNQSSEAVYRMLSRIRHDLHNCVNKSLAGEMS